MDKVGRDMDNLATLTDSKIVRSWCAATTCAASGSARACARNICLLFDHPSKVNDEMGRQMEKGANNCILRQLMPTRTAETASLALAISNGSPLSRVALVYFCDLADGPDGPGRPALLRAAAVAVAVDIFLFR